ncbi:MAG: hypothetical protein NC417_12760 [Candidatus Gastranaerophilales bacterium]|nr:hypothetical protein [Candidatus Gastranaerophilales bacterium]
MAGITAAVLSLATDFVKGVATPENISAVISVLKGKTKKLSTQAQEAVRQAEELGNEELPKETLDVLKGCVNEVLREQISPVYASCVSFFIEGMLSQDEQELIRKAIMGLYDPGEDKRAVEKMDFIEEFMFQYIEAFDEDIGEGEDYEISGKYLSLNFHDIDSHVRCEEDMRNMADALNYLLGYDYIQSFSLL